MFYNPFLSNISYLFLLIFCYFLSINAEAKYLNNDKIQDYSVEFHFINDSKLNNYRIASLDNLKNTVDSTNSSYSFSEFGLDDELNNENELFITINDPFERINRKSFIASIWLDKHVFHYITNIYIVVVAKPIRRGLLNAINNFNEPINIVNHLLQFKIISFSKTTARFIVNSTLGCFGFIDVASNLNLPPNYNDFGYTLSYYKISDGFYIFLPLLGPYTLQTAISDVITNYSYSVSIEKLIHMNSFAAVASNVAERALPYIESQINVASILNSSEDPYTLVKSAYIQNRKAYLQKLIHSW